jgi:hypothetical protein
MEAYCEEPEAVAHETREDEAEGRAYLKGYTEKSIVQFKCMLMWKKADSLIHDRNRICLEEQHTLKNGPNVHHNASYHRIGIITM